PGRFPGWIRGRCGSPGRGSWRWRRPAGERGALRRSRGARSGTISALLFFPVLLVGRLAEAQKATVEAVASLDGLLVDRATFQVADGLAALELGFARPEEGRRARADHGLAFERRGRVVVIGRDPRLDLGLRQEMKRGLLREGALPAGYRIERI